MNRLDDLMQPKIVAVLLYVVSTDLTYQFVQGIALREDLFILVLAVAVIVQLIFIMTERALFQNNIDPRWKAVALFMFAVDSVINAGGVYRFIPNIATSDVYKMFAESLGWAATLHPVSVLVVSIVIGGLVAVMGDVLWNLKTTPTQPQSRVRSMDMPQQQPERKAV